MQVFEARPGAPPLPTHAVKEPTLLYWRRLPLLRRGYEPGAGLTAPIQRFQSGVINDYVTWMVLGLAVIGGVLALIIR